MYDKCEDGAQRPKRAEDVLIVRFSFSEIEASGPELMVGQAYFDEFAVDVPDWVGQVREADELGWVEVRLQGLKQAHRCEILQEGAGTIVMVVKRSWKQSQVEPPHVRKTPQQPKCCDQSINMAQIVDRATEAIAVLCLDGGILRYAVANHAYRALAGVNDLVGKAYGSIFFPHAELENDLRAMIAFVMKTSMRQERRQVAVTLDWGRDGVLTTKYFDFSCEALSTLYQGNPYVVVYAHDVTRNVRGFKKARDTEAYFRRIVDSLSQIVWSCNEKGEIDWLNDRWYEFTGQVRNCENQADFASFMHPDEREVSIQAWVEAMQQQQPYSAEMRIKDRHGIYRWFLVLIRPLRDEASGILRWYGSSTDIHDQKMANHAVVDLLENMSDGFMMIDGDWIIRNVNERHVEQTQIPREEQLGRHMEDVFFPQELARDTVYLANCRKAKALRISMSFDEYYAPLNMWTAVSLYPTDSDGLAIIYRNLSPERLLQKSIEDEKQKFEAVFFDSPACMALLAGPNLIYEKVNARYQALYGDRKLVGLSVGDAAPELENQPFIHLMQKVFETGIPYVAQGMACDLVSTETGALERFYFDFSYGRILDNKGLPYGINLHAIDVTDKVLASRRADALAVSLTEAIRGRDDFLSSASHELKTPVTSIKMQLQMTRRHVKPDEGLVPPAVKLAKMLDICGKQVDRMSALIEDLLDVSRIGAGKMTFNFCDTDVSALVTEVLAQFSDHFDAAACPLEVFIAPTRHVMCDAFRIEQVLVNLVTNAFKYGHNSTIRVRVEELDTGVRVMVADGGMGISVANQAKIFERFERAVTHENVSGLGLGLFICREILKAHGGDISVSSVLGEGSTFTVDLPFNQRLDGAVRAL